MVIKQEEHIAGRESFGTLDAEILSIDNKKHTFQYKITGSLPHADGGVMSQDGYAPIKILKGDRKRAPQIGDKVRMVVFLVRGSDGVKYNHVAEGELNA